MSQTMSPISTSQSVLIVMTHVKIGDFLLLAPLLRDLCIQRSNVTVAIPKILYPVLKIQNFIPRAICASRQLDVLCAEDASVVLDLTYPLLNHVEVPRHHRRLRADLFMKAQHATLSYLEALRELFSEVTFSDVIEPYLDFAPDSDLLGRFGLLPFRYYTVHSGSDFYPKNWDPAKFEESISVIQNKYPDLICVGITGPCDEPLFKNAEAPSWFRNLSSSLEDVAHVLAGSLFHLDNDSGIHHLAGVMDVPSITVWGPTGPGTWASISKRNFVHWGGPNCERHCEGYQMVDCQDRVCLSSIRPSEVLSSAQKIMAHYD